MPSARSATATTRGIFYAALLVVAAVDVAPLALRGTLPAFQQDWAWPVDAWQIGPFVHSGFAGAQTASAGLSSNPTPWWPFVLAGVLCYALGVHGGVVALLLLAIFGASAAAAAFAAADVPNRMRTRAAARESLRRGL